MCSGTCIWTVDSHVVWAFLTVDVVKAIWIVDVDCGYSVVEIHGYRITGVLGLIPRPVLTYFILCCWPVLCCWPAHWNFITEIVPVKGIEPELCFLCGWRGGVL